MPDVRPVIPAIHRWFRERFDGPMRMALGVGFAIGLLFVFVAPPWSGGADEASHFARSLDIANGNLTPRVEGDDAFSAIPRSYRQDQDLVIAQFGGPAPIDGSLISKLLDSHPDWTDTVDYDTRSTTASSPVGYLPSAIAMMLPNTFGAPGVVVMWFGRLADLLVYLALIGVALSVARAFRWVFAVGVIIPMNLAQAASVSPDSLTIAGIVLVLAVLTRVWSEAMVRHNAHRADHETEPALFDAAVRVQWSTIAWVFGSGLLLALAKPPYFLVLGLFAVLALVVRRDRTVLASAGAAVAAIVAGGLATLVNVSSSYSGVAVSIAVPIQVQPDVQKQRIVDDPLGFLWRCVTNWFDHLGETVQKWSRAVGIWTSDPPHWLPWVLIMAFVVAAVLLDRNDFLRLRGLLRWSAAAGAVLLIVAIYASAYVWFDDTLEGRHMGDQIARYSLPLFPLAMMGWIPRWSIALAGRANRGRFDARLAGYWVLAVGLVAEVTLVAAVSINWVSTGRG